MVLIRVAFVVLVGLVAACGQSLFDNRPGGGSGSGRDGGPDITPGSCTAPCIADAAVDFDGTPRGKSGQWRYLEDYRNHQWGAMTLDGAELKGDDARNRIAPCSARPDAPACSMLPGALLVSSAGADGIADPALEFAAASAQVIQLTVRVLVPSGDDQLIRLYRNGREDALLTGVAAAGSMLERTIQLDALPGDRFLVAVEHTAAGGGATDMGLDLTISATSATFPSSCLLALTFETKTGNSVRDLCRGGLFVLLMASGAQAQLALPNGPYFEQGTSGNILGGTRLHDLTDKLYDHTRGLTVQFWIKLEQFIQPNAAVALSNLDIDTGGGLSISIKPDLTPLIDVATATSGGATIVDKTAPYPALGTWQFVRVVHTSTAIDLCLNGTRVTHLDVATTGLPALASIELGKDALAPSSEAFFTGQLDDVRVFTGALPCE